MISMGVEHILQVSGCMFGVELHSEPPHENQRSCIISSHQAIIDKVTGQQGQHCVMQTTVAVEHLRN